MDAPDFRDATDEGTWRDVQAGWHRPPLGVYPDTILDLGCHAGFTVMDYAERFPRARIWAAEVDPHNFEQARENVRSMGPNKSRVFLRNVGIATWDGYCALDTRVPHNARRITGKTDGGIACETLDTYLEGVVLSGGVLAKFDIEGMERDVFREGGEWERKIDWIVAELHRYPVDEAIEDLNWLGFDAQEIVGHPTSAIWAVGRALVETR